MKLNKNKYEFFLHRDLAGGIQRINQWDFYIKNLAEDLEIKKINGVIIDKKNNVVKKSYLKEKINNSVENLPPKFANDLYIKINESLENQEVKINKNYIVFLNGKYNIKTGIFEPGIFESINKIRWNYNENASSKLGEEIIKRYIGKNDNFDIQVFEVVGLLASQDKDFGFKKTIFFNGPSNYGKSFLFEKIIKPTIGEQNIAQINFSQLNDYETAGLINKTAAYDPDMEKGKISSASLAKIKTFTGDNTLIGKLLYKDKFEFKNYSTAWINCNGLPIMIDRGSGGAAENRMHVLQATINVKEKFNEPKLADKIEKKQKEISEWLLKNAMKYLTKAIEKGELTKTLASINAVEMELGELDTVEKFLKDPNFKLLGISPVKLHNFYDRYVKSFEIGKINSHETHLKKISFYATLRDLQKKYNYKIYKTNGYMCIKLLSNNKKGGE